MVYADRGELSQICLGRSTNNIESKKRGGVPNLMCCAISARFKEAVAQHLIYSRCELACPDPQGTRAQVPYKLGQFSQVARPHYLYISTLNSKSGYNEANLLAAFCFWSHYLGEMAEFPRYPLVITHTYS